MFIVFSLNISVSFSGIAPFGYRSGPERFSGDTIFRECVGRCDLEGGDFDQIVESIENKIFTLPAETIIYPGHGSRTTVGWEKEHNRFL